MPSRLAPDLPASRIVGARVHALRTERGWTLRETARQVEAAGKPIGYATIQRLERNRNPAAPVVAVIVDDLIALAIVFGLRPDELLAAPDCVACMDKPPAGFACRTCGATA
ncbi:helix-turn-helix transcriptional regulator [Streptomyces sp. NPDC005732]|uniref:helix-turn-helix domain-containing protein n=1 Tax=Streptomyces sp. NPDC005732 TaxID=3157057 RepID=UPI0033FF2214